MKTATIKQATRWGSADFSTRMALFIEQRAPEELKRTPIYVTQGEKKPRAKRTNLDPYPRGNDADRKDRKSTRLNSSHIQKSRMPSSA